MGTHAHSRSRLSPLPAHWRRPVLAFTWAVVGLAALSGALLFAAGPVKTGIELALNSNDVARLRSDCLRLTQEVDSMVIVSRAHPGRRALTPVALSDLTEEVAANGLTLLEYSLVPGTGRGSTSAGRWRVVAAGSAQAWGLFLSRLDEYGVSPRVVSGTWSTKGWLDAQVRGEIVLTIPKSDAERL